MSKKFLGNHPIGVGRVYWWHRINLPETGYTNGAGVHGPDGGDWPTTRFGMPLDLTDKNVLDIGCWDGFFSFEAEKRGANVLAVDCSFDGEPSRGFQYAHTALNSKVVWEEFNLEGKVELGLKFHVVLCYGVLYHVKSPLLCMERLAKMVFKDGICLLETAISNIKAPALLEYKPLCEGDPNNFFYPNLAWLELAAMQVGFSSMEVIYNKDSRATIKLTKAL